MAIVVFEHHPVETSCRIGAYLQDYGHRLRIVELHAGESVPPDLDDVDGVLSMGGPMNVDEKDDHPWIDPELAFLKAAHEAGKPVLGICLGTQLIAEALGGEVGPMGNAEVGWGPVRQEFMGTTDPVLAGIPWYSTQFHAHGQEVTNLPAGAAVLASSPACKVQAFRIGLTTYGFQYHFEWTKADLNRILPELKPWLTRIGADVQQIRSQTAEHYDLYRHLGDRLCNRLTDLLFPLDKRLDHKVGPVQNYHASHF